MDRHGTKHVDIPKWSALLVEAVNKPGLIMDAYTAFHNDSIGNQILALVQSQMRGLEPGPINTFPGWRALGRNVKRGERALILCMPITRKVRDEEAQESDGENGERTFTSFMHKARWFVISQTIGDEFTRHACEAQLVARHYFMKQLHEATLVISIAAPCFVNDTKTPRRV